MNPVERAQARGARKTYFNIGTLPYWGVHVAAIVGVCLLGFSWAALAWVVGSYYARLFFVTGGYHRYFSHRSFKTSRPFQFLLAFGATTTVQKGVLWWAHHHRHHHRRSDKDDDLHTTKQGGFWWSHHGWILSDDFESTDYDKIKDFARYPELRWLNKYHLVPPIALAVLLYGVWGPVALWYGFFVGTVVAWHGTFTINSLMHSFGRRPYKTDDESRNTLTLALLTMGEGWHNNHHHYQVSCRQGFRWWQIDLTFYLLTMMSWVGLVWDLRAPPKHILENRPKDVSESVNAALAAHTLEPEPEPAVASPTTAGDLAA